jgi:hypothetical protein
MKLNALLASTLAALLACSGTKNAHRMSTSKSNSEAFVIVQQYVATHKGWRSTDYIIEQHGSKDGYVVYFVRYLPEQPGTSAGRRRPVIAGGGKSFDVYYDPTKRRVVKEMHFQ